jgi:hypothetical protein
VNFDVNFDMGEYDPRVIPHG